MKKTLIALAAITAFGVVSAEEAKQHNWYDITGWYGSGEYSYKEKVYGQGQTNLGEFHDVMAMTIGARFHDGWSVEALTETEKVDYSNGTGTQAQEGLTQIGIGKSFKTDTIFTPYLKLATGYKFKKDSSFQIWRFDLGTNIKLNDDWGLQVNVRHRQANSEYVDLGATALTATKYNTNESTLGIVYKFTPKDSIRLAKKIERQTESHVSSLSSSEYNTTSLTYSRSF